MIFVNCYGNNSSELGVMISALFEFVSIIGKNAKPLMLIFSKPEMTGGLLAYLGLQYFLRFFTFGYYDDVRVVRQDQVSLFTKGHIAIPGNDLHAVYRCNLCTTSHVISLGFYEGS